MDRFDIKAEINRGGSSLSDIAQNAGLDPSACSQALIYPIPRANAAIAAHLNKSLHELWPRWFDEQGDLVPGVSSRIRKKRRSSRKVATV